MIRRHPKAFFAIGSFAVIGMILSGMTIAPLSAVALMACLWLSSKSQKDQFKGALAIALSWSWGIFCWGAFSGSTEMFGYMLGDMAAATYLARIAFRDHALWAVCASGAVAGQGVINALAAAVMALQPEGYPSAGASVIMALNILFALSLLSVFLGVILERCDQHRSVDRRVHRLVRGWTFTGASLEARPESRVYHPQAD